MADTDQRRRRLSWGRKLGYSAGLLALLAAFAEIALRVVDPEIFRFVYNARQLHRYPTWHKVDLRPNRRATLALSRADGTDLFRFTMTTDAQGLRTSGAAAPAAAEGARARTVVHCIGDSLTMGWGVEDDRTYPAYLGEMLGEAYAVLNVGVDGFGALAADEKSRRAAEHAAPDIVAYLFCSNDFVDDQITQDVRDRSAIEHGFWRAVDRVREWTYIGNVPFAIKWALFYRDARGRAAPTIGPAATETEIVRAELLAQARDVIPTEHLTTSAITAMAERHRREGRRFMVVVTQTGPAAARIIRWCEDHAIPHVVFPITDPAWLLPADLHFNPEGNRRLAQRLALEIGGVNPP